MTIKEAFLIFNLNPDSYFKSCESQVEANNTLNFIKEIVKKTYKKLALMYHPDSNLGIGNPEKFAKFTEAKNILLDLEIKPNMRVMNEEVIFPYSTKWKKWGIDEDIGTSYTWAGTDYSS